MATKTPHLFSSHRGGSKTDAEVNSINTTQSNPVKIMNGISLWINR